jgi:hypothetical protein
MNTYSDVLQTLQELLANNASGCGCVTVYIDGLAATLHWVSVLRIARGSMAV